LSDNRSPKGLYKIFWYFQDCNAWYGIKRKNPRFEKSKLV